VVAVIVTIMTITGRSICSTNSDVTITERSICSVNSYCGGICVVFIVIVIITGRYICSASRCWDNNGEVCMQC